jgi:hypothetical protein
MITTLACALLMLQARNPPAASGGDLLLQSVNLERSILFGGLSIQSETEILQGDARQSLSLNRRRVGLGVESRGQSPRSHTFRG